MNLPPGVTKRPLCLPTLNPASAFPADGARMMAARLPFPLRLPEVLPLCYSELQTSLKEEDSLPPTGSSEQSAFPYVAYRPINPSRERGLTSHWSQTDTQSLRLRILTPVEMLSVSIHILNVFPSSIKEALQQALL